ncbi:MAG: DNA translocase FtsK [Clostridia bacterium]|nr:DNA translocase FtsK [Clostridia bacterium]
MPSKTTTKKKTSASSKTGSRKTTGNKAASGRNTSKKALNAEIRKKEISAGIAMLLSGIILLVIAFQPPITGMVGPAIKAVFMGIFGSFGYVIPMVLITLGIVLLFKKTVGINWGQVILWSIFFLCSVLLFHTFFLREIFAGKRVVEVDYMITTFSEYMKSCYSYGADTGRAAGGLGGVLSYWLLKNFGIFGVIFVPLTYILIVLILKNKSTLRTLAESTKARMDESIERRMSQQTPLEKLGAEKPARETERRQIQPEYQSQRSTSSPKADTLHVMKERKQPLYVEDIRVSESGSPEEGDLNTGFLLKHNTNPISSGRTNSYSVNEDQWSQALEEEHSKESVGRHTKDEAKPTIQINITDKDDYKAAATAKQPAHATEYQFPPLDIIAFSNNKLDESLRAECHTNAMKLEETLSSFRVDAKVINITCGPTVTRYELRPAPGVRVAKINNLSRDLAMALAATSVRIEAPIPNKNAVGIEVPNRTRSLVGLRDILEGSKFKTSKSPLTICVGKDITGRNIVADLAKMPHMLVAGATGSGKSVFINALILSLIYKSSPEDVRFIMVDPKKVELNIYNGIPHLLIPVVTKASMAASALNWAVKEMMKRYDIFAESGVRNLEAYNKLAATKGSGLKPFPSIVIIVDELADLMQVASAEVEDAIYRLAQLARAAGMHLVIATQRPDVKVITGTIKANIPCRVAFSVNQLVDSRTILDGSGAEHLLGNGDMLFKFGGKPIRLQGAFVADKEVEKVCDFLRAEGVKYDDTVIEDVKKIEQQSQDGPGSFSGESGDGFDRLMPDAVKVIYENDKTSTSFVQRKLRIGYNRAASIMDDLERVGVLGPAEGSSPREIIVTYGTAMQIVSGDDE